METIIHLKVSEENTLRKTSKYILCGLTLSPMTSKHTSSRGTFRKDAGFHTQLPSWVPGISHCVGWWNHHTHPASSHQGRGQGGSVSPVLYLQPCVDVLATLSSLSPGICLAPQHTQLSMFWHELPLCCHATGAPTFLPQHLPSQSRVPEATVSHCYVHPKTLLREEDRFLLCFVYSKAEAVLPTELKKWKESLRWHFKRG